MKKILIFGAASAIAHQTAIQFAKDAAWLYLVDISKARVDAVRDDILTRFQTQIFTDELNANQFELHNKLISDAYETMQGLDAILIAHGTLPDQEKIRQNPQAILKEFSTNCLSVISLATIAANFFEKKKKGCIAVISSVAGDRGRQSNYIYGSAKGAVSIFLQGLRNRLYKEGVNVITIKPGLVDTPMTAHLPKSPLFAKPDDVGKAIYKAMLAGKDVAYIPSFWRVIMTVVKAIPESIFKKLNF